MEKIDARGLSCPEPVLLAKEALKTKKPFEILLSTKAARDNVISIIEKDQRAYQETIVNEDELNEYLVMMETISEALFCEKQLKDKMDLHIISVPRKVSTSCGYAILLLEKGDASLIEKILMQHQIEFSEIFLFKNDEYIKMIEVAEHS